jgi:hypothetical protein
MTLNMIEHKLSVWNKHMKFYNSQVNTELNQTLSRITLDQIKILESKRLELE